MTFMLASGMAKLNLYSTYRLKDVYKICSCSQHEKSLEKVIEKIYCGTKQVKGFEHQIRFSFVILNTVFNRNTVLSNHPEFCLVFHFAFPASGNTTHLCSRKAFRE